MKNNQTIFCFFALALLLAMGSCRKKKCYDPTNRDCENYDPCYGADKPNADFKTRHWSHWGTDPFPGETIEFCDTIISTTAKFTANYMNGDSYFWKVGTDSRDFTGKELELDFGDYYNDLNNLENPGSDFYKPIPVTLAVRTKASSRNKIGICVPLKDTLINLKRNLVLAKNNENRICGVYKGRVDGENQDRIIKVYYKYDINRPYYQFYYGFINLPNMINHDTLKIGYGQVGAMIRTFKNLKWNHGKRYSVGIEGYDNINGIYAGSIFCELQQDGKKYIRFEYTSVTKDLKTEKTYIFTGKEM